MMADVVTGTLTSFSSSLYNLIYYNLYISLMIIWDAIVFFKKKKPLLSAIGQLF